MKILKETRAPVGDRQLQYVQVFGSLDHEGNKVTDVSQWPRKKFTKENSLLTSKSNLEPR